MATNRGLFRVIPESDWDPWFVDACPCGGFCSMRCVVLLYLLLDITIRKHLCVQIDFLY